MITETRYTLTGLKCGGCVAKATAALQALPGVTTAQVDLATQTARVEGEAAPTAVIGALNAAGYPAALNTV
jgi:copper chaperone CopZ